MAVYSVSGSATAAPSTVTLAQPWPTIRVFNRGTTELWLRIDGQAAAVAGDDNFFVPAGKFVVFNIPTNSGLDQGNPSESSTNTTVSVASSASCPFTVFAGSYNDMAV